VPIGAVKGGDQDARSFATSNVRSQHRVIARVAMNNGSNKIAGVAEHNFLEVQVYERQTCLQHPH